MKLNTYILIIISAFLFIFGIGLHTGYLNIISSLITSYFIGSIAYAIIWNQTKSIISATIVSLIFPILCPIINNQFQNNNYINECKIIGKYNEISNRPKSSGPTLGPLKFELSCKDGIKIINAKNNGKESKIDEIIYLRKGILGYIKIWKNAG